MVSYEDNEEVRQGLEVKKTMVECAEGDKQ